MGRKSSLEVLELLVSTAPVRTALVYTAPVYTAPIIAPAIKVTATTATLPSPTLVRAPTKITYPAIVVSPSPTTSALVSTPVIVTKTLTPAPATTLVSPIKPVPITTMTVIKPAPTPVPLSPLTPTVTTAPAPVRLPRIFMPIAPTKAMVVRTAPSAVKSMVKAQPLVIKEEAPVVIEEKKSGIAGIALILGGAGALFVGYRVLKSKKKALSGLDVKKVKHLAPKRSFDKRSFRTKKVKKGVSIIVGCPKGKWQARKKRCKAGMRAYEIIKY